jgi:hypothetical protein
MSGFCTNSPAVHRQAGKLSFFLDFWEVLFFPVCADIKMFLDVIITLSKVEILLDAQLCFSHDLV